MKLITLEQAKSHVKSDGDDDDVLKLCVDAAEAWCASLANRALFVDEEDRTLAHADIGGMLTSAWATYDSAVVAADAATDIRVGDIMHSNAGATLRMRESEVDRLVHGIVVTDDILAAVLLFTAHFYANREEVIAGTQAAVAELPLGGKHIMMRHYWIGP